MKLFINGSPKLDNSNANYNWKKKMIKNNCYNRSS